MKKLTIMIITVIVTVTCINISCFANDTVNVYNEDEMLQALLQGEHAVLQKNIAVSYDDILYLPYDNVIDLNGHRLNIMSKDYTIDSNLCFVNGDVILTGELQSTGNMTIKGVLSIKNGTINLSHVSFRMNSYGYLLVGDKESSLYFNSSIHHTPYTELNVDVDEITKETFFDMIKNEKLPELSREGYIFMGWENAAGKEVTSWRSTIHEKITPIFTKANTEESLITEQGEKEGTVVASAFGHGSIWIILTFAFLLSTIVLAIAYIRKK